MDFLLNFFVKNTNRNLILSLLTGFLLGLAWNYFPSAIFVALVPLLILEKEFSNPNLPRQGNIFGLIWLSFLIWNVSAAWWVGYASLPGAIALLSFNSFCLATVFWAFHVAKRRLKVENGAWLLIIFWLTFEYLYQKTEISWPWFNLGNIFGSMAEFVQWYEYTGTLGGSLWILIINFLIADIAVKYIQKRQLSFSKASLAVACLITPIAISWTIYRSYEEINSPVKITVIQPNIDPYTQKFAALNPQEQLGIILKEAESFSKADYYVAPETAIIGENNESELNNNLFIKRIRTFLNDKPRTKFIIGAETQQKSLNGEKRYNAALQVDSSKKIQIYHKSKLVLGVEKMPFAKYFKFLEKFHINLGGSAGNMVGQEKREVLRSGRVGVAPIICFESVYGEYTTNYVKEGATLLFILTNDGWWKNSQGTWQHLHLSRLRAIETRRSVARSANTGISALINQRGDIIHYLEWNQRGTINGSLNNNNTLTFYVHFGDFIGITALISSLVSIAVLIIKRIKPR